ncbi:hypothetical protein PG995_005713 [Apiospora arundinis]|uniref:Short-chain dehydrogenase/reductase family protein n=1 Tax=Apiospora arundinis TaxID=335852 RepID=A0ABR2IBG2_9PEZI
MATQPVSFDITPEQEASKLQFLRRQFFRTPPRVTDVDLDGKTAIVTGANGGIGLECCRQLLELGISNLILAVRDETKGEVAQKVLSAVKPSQSIQVWKLDYSSYDSVTAFAKRAEELPRLDIAILNAGVNRGFFSANPETGHEDDLQTNYLSTVLLTILLLRITRRNGQKETKGPSTAATQASNLNRIVLVSSDTPGWAQFPEKDQNPLLPSFDDKNAKYHAVERYATTKLLSQLFLTELAKRVSPATAGTIVNCANPGLCHGSAIARELGRPSSVFMRLVGRPAAVGARSIVHAATKEGERSHGQLVEDCQLRPMAPFVYSKEAVVVTGRLWEETMKELSFAEVKEIIETLS